MTHIEVAQPLQDGGIILLGLAQQGSLLVLGLNSSQLSCYLDILASGINIVKVQARFQDPVRIVHTVTATS